MLKTAAVGVAGGGGGELTEQFYKRLGKNSHWLFKVGVAHQHAGGSLLIASLHNYYTHEGLNLYCTQGSQTSDGLLG